VILRNRKDLASGLMYLVVGLAFAILSAGYEMGTPTRMGPGYFPFWLGCILALLGAALVAGSARPGAAVEELSAWDMRALAVVLLSVAAFGLLLEPAGLLVSVAVLVLAGSFASREFSWGAALLNAAALAAISVVIFVYGLGLRFAVWPGFLGG
jgi:hypothetical protein